MKRAERDLGYHFNGKDCDRNCCINALKTGVLFVYGLVSDNIVLK